MIKSPWIANLFGHHWVDPGNVGDWVENPIWVHWMGQRLRLRQPNSQNLDVLNPVFPLILAYPWGPHKLWFGDVQSSHPLVDASGSPWATDDSSGVVGTVPGGKMEREKNVSKPQTNQYLTKSQNVINCTEGLSALTNVRNESLSQFFTWPPAEPKSSYRGRLSSRGLCWGIKKKTIRTCLCLRFSWRILV